MKYFPDAKNVAVNSNWSYISKFGGVKRDCEKDINHIIHGNYLKDACL